jgi:hypothetical protein
MLGGMDGIGLVACWDLALCATASRPIALVQMKVRRFVTDSPGTANLPEHLIIGLAARSVWGLRARTLRACRLAGGA